MLPVAAEPRSCKLFAELENQMGSAYSFDDDECGTPRLRRSGLWSIKRSSELRHGAGDFGIPTDFAPSLDLEWSARGYANTLDKRRAELRRMAQTQVEAIERKAITEIEMSCLHAQEQIAIAGLTSDAAKRILRAVTFGGRSHASVVFSRDRR